MKPKLIIQTIATTALLATTFASNAQETAPENPERPTRTSRLERYDTNKDGTIDSTERQAMRAEVSRRVGRINPDAERPNPRLTKEQIAKYDKDGDGRLNAEESKAMREAMRARLMEITKKYDKDGNGRLGAEERAALRADIEAGKVKNLPPGLAGRRNPERDRRDIADIIKEFDKDEDGKLSPEEREAAREALRSRRAEPKPEASK